MTIAVKRYSRDEALKLLARSLIGAGLLLAMILIGVQLASLVDVTP